MRLVHVKPKRRGLVVRDPVSKVKLPIAGAWVEHGSYWERRLDAEEIHMIVPAPDIDPPTDPPGGGGPPVHWPPLAVLRSLPRGRLLRQRQANRPRR